jgi:ATP-dependent exoDNAse (exonuclease V) alpha subunit
VLKEGCPVILIRNISEGLFNGARGIVHSLKKDSLPVISING